jgi:hypothetical protein
MDDHSRFVTGYGLHASQSSALVLEVMLISIKRATTSSRCDRPADGHGASDNAKIAR